MVLPPFKVRGVCADIFILPVTLFDGYNDIVQITSEQIEHSDHRYFVSMIFCHAI